VQTVTTARSALSLSSMANVQSIRHVSSSRGRAAEIRGHNAAASPQGCQFCWPTLSAVDRESAAHRKSARPDPNATLAAPDFHIADPGASATTRGVLLVDGGVSPDHQRPYLAEARVLLAWIGVYLDEVGNTLDEVGNTLRVMDAIQSAIGASRVDHGINGGYLCANRADNRAFVSAKYANRACLDVNRADICARDIQNDANSDEGYANLALTSSSPARLCAIVGHTVAIAIPRLTLGRGLVARQALRVLLRRVAGRPCRRSHSVADAIGS